MILSVTDLREHVETDVSDVALQRLADAAELEINKAGGKPESRTDKITSTAVGAGRTANVFVNRSIGSIDSIAERDVFEAAPVTLSANDYERIGQRELRRLRGGDNPRLFWAPITEITYTPAVNTSARQRAQIDLVKLGVEYSAFENERYGDVNLTRRAPAEAVEAALRPVRSRPMVV